MKIATSVRDFSLPVLAVAAGLCGLIDRPSIDQCKNYPETLAVAQQIDATGRRVLVTTCGLGLNAHACIEFQDGFVQQTFMVKIAAPDKTVLHNINPLRSDQCMVVRSTTDKQKQIVVEEQSCRTTGL